MIARMRSFRKLDKDLGRISNAEYARQEALRPVLQPVAALLGLAFLSLAIVAALGIGSEWGLFAGGVALAAALALLVGSDGLAGTTAPAIGAGAIGPVAGLVLIGLMQVAGLMLAGGPIAERLTSGLVLPGPGTDAVITARIMASALFAAVTWGILATWAGAPVSPTHAIIGAIIGAGAVSLGWESLQWGGFAVVVAGWLASPVIAAMLAATMLALLRWLLQEHEDPLRAAKIWLPCLIAVITALFTLHVVTLTGMPDAKGWLAVAGTALVCAAVGGVVSRALIQRQIAPHRKARAALKAAFNLPLVVSTLLMGFAFGANDTPTIVAPLVTIFRSAKAPGMAFGGWLPLLAGLGLAAAAIIFGRRLVDMLGGRATRLNASRAFCVSLATAITVIGAAAFGMPVSTIHVAVGGVFGVGLYRDMLENQAADARPRLPKEELARRHLLRLSHLRSALLGWLTTATATALLAAGAAFALTRL